MIELKEHNKRAYIKLRNILKDHNKVAIIQPPNTGKSYIAFKYIEDEFLDKSINRVLYITSYKTVINDTKRKLLRNEIDCNKIDVIGYSSLRNNDSFQKLLKKKYDLIILDEYQHAGATLSNIKIKELLDFYNRAKVIGLTATPVRHLDNKRDMTKELFNNVKAVDMSLVEAIKEGILPEMTYITALYKYDEYIDDVINQYKSLIPENDNDEANKIISKLATYKSGEVLGVKNIFKKYLKTGGKYIIFVKDVNQMNEMIRSIQTDPNHDFNAVDNFPNIYMMSYLNKDESNFQNYLEFINDKSNHLDLMFTINMGTEGLHFESDSLLDENNIDGVIFFRNTMSANLFIQMLGRGFSLKKPLIIDLANNIYNDYSIESFKNELNKLNKFNYETNKPTNINVLDRVIEVKNYIKKLKKICTTDSWDNSFYSILGKVINKDSIFPITFNNTKYNNLEELLLLEDKDILSLNLINKEELIYLREEITKFSIGILSVNKINKLKMLGLFNDFNRFEDFEIEYIDKEFKDINLKSKKLDIGSFEWVKHLTYYFVINYYHHIPNQNYTLEDYVENLYFEIASNFMNQKIKEKNINIYRFKNQLLKYISKFIINEQKYIDNKNLDGSDIGLLIDKQSVYSDYEEENLKENIKKLRKNLRGNLRDVLNDRYGFDGRDTHTFKEISKKNNCSETHVSQLVKKTERILRGKIFRKNECGLLDYDFNTTHHFDIRNSIDIFKQKYSLQIKEQIPKYYNDFSEIIENSLYNWGDFLGEEYFDRRKVLFDFIHRVATEDRLDQSILKYVDNECPDLANKKYKK